jgi:hypothetical protein
MNSVFYMVRAKIVIAETSLEVSQLQQSELSVVSCKGVCEERTLSVQLKNPHC